jgi:hypothetical protein
MHLMGWEIWYLTFILSSVSRNCGKSWNVLPRGMGHYCAYHTETHVPMRYALQLKTDYSCNKLSVIVQLRQFAE